MKRKQTTANEVGKRLRIARENLGLDIQTISYELKIPIDVIEDIENGSIESHYLEIFAIACRLSKPIHEIFRDFFNYNNTQIFFLRDKSDSTDSEEVKKYVLDYIRLQQEIYGGFSVLSLVNDPEDTRRVKDTLPAILEGRARDLCRRTDVHKLPINVYQIAANLGMVLTFETLPKSLHGLRGFSYKESGFHLIVINKVHSVELQRFTVAHELHHLLYDSSSTLFSCGSFNEDEVLERNAEHFAAELLMPRSSIERIISYPKNIQYLTINLLAKHFNVSYQAAAIRLQNFGLVDSSSDACTPSYRKKDKEKTKFLLENKLKYLEAIFGLETGITELQINHSLHKHELCGAYIFDTCHTKCWNCGLSLGNLGSKDIYLNNPYLQSPSNLRSGKVLAVTQKDDVQLSLNFRTS
ncbi:MAG: hypothetical protein Kow00121_17730 [Elainellaceae cyanobacterium]